MFPGKNVLITEDDPVTLETIASFFEVEGYHVFRDDSGNHVEAKLAQHAIDLLLLDIRLPGIDGLTLLKKIREKSTVPVIVVSAKADKVDKIVALEMGADDYVEKPFEPRELLARANCLFRRINWVAKSDKTQRKWYFDGWILDEGGRRMTSPKGEDVHLTRGEFEILVALLTHKGRVMLRDNLLGYLSDRERDPFDRTIDVLIGRLRRKLKCDPKGAQMIATVHGLGYIFSSDVTVKQ